MKFDATKGKASVSIRKHGNAKIVWPHTAGVRTAAHMESKHREKQGKITANFQNA